MVKSKIIAVLMLVASTGGAVAADVNPVVNSAPSSAEADVNPIVNCMC